MKSRARVDRFGQISPSTKDTGSKTSLMEREGCSTQMARSMRASGSKERCRGKEPSKGRESAILETGKRTDLMGRDLKYLPNANTQETMSLGKRKGMVGWSGQMETITRETFTKTVLRGKESLIGQGKKFMKGSGPTT